MCSSVQPADPPLPAPAPAPAGKVVLDVFRLAWPAMMQAFMATVVFFSDRLMLGWYGKEELAALIPSGSILWSITSVFGVWTVGTLAVVARDKGAGKAAAIREHVATSLWLSALIGVLVSVPGMFCAPALVGLFGASDAVAGNAAAYLRVLLAAMPLTFAGMTMMAAFTGTGNTLTPMLASAASNAVNVAGNLLLIFGNLGFPRLGIRGAAISSALAFCVFAALMLTMGLRRRSPVGLDFSSLLGASRSSLRRILKVSLPAAMERTIFHAGFIGYAMIVTALGTTAMAAQEILIAIQSIVFLPGEGFGVAAGSIMGRALGAGRVQDARTGARAATWMAIAPLAAAGLAYVIAPELLIGLFSEDADIAAAGATALIVGAFEGIFLGAYQTISGGIRGAGETRTPMLVTTSGIWLVRLPACALFGLPPESTFGLGLGLGLTGIWLGTLTDWIFRCTLITIAFNSGRWERVKV